MIALLAIVLLAPALGTGFMMDDHAHRATFEPEMARHMGSRAAWDMFRFFPSDPAKIRALVESGILPWWTAPGSRLAFFRPISSLTLALDYHAWPEVPAIMHAESVLAFAATALFAGLFYRRILRATACAGLAALIFAVDDAHAMAVVWIANRHAILSALFGTAALLAHDHARRDGWRPGRVLAPLAFAASMLAGEGGLGTLTYLLAYAIFLDRASMRSRALSLVPHAAVALGWFAAYKLGGYGARAGAFYIDPLHETGDYLAATAQRLPVLLAAQLAAPPADLWMGLPAEKLRGFGITCAAVVLVIGGALFAVLRRDRRAGFFALGMTLCLLPSCATWPSDRLLLFSGLGGAGLVASMISASRAELGRFTRVLAGAVTGVFVLLHLVVAPLFLPLRTYGTGMMMQGYTERAIASLPDDDAMRGRTLLVVSAPDGVIANMALAARINAHRALPEVMRVLAVAVQGSLRVARPDDRTLAITVSDGFWHEATTKVYRDPRKAPFAVGDRIALTGMVVEIAALTPDGAQPARILFHFERSLDDPSFTFIHWSETRFAPFVVPAIGEERALPVVSYQKAFSG